VTGDQFLANQAVSIYWDVIDKVLGSTRSDAGGHFVTSVKAPDNESPGVHQICASVPPRPCAQFLLQPRPTPSPNQPSPSPPPPPPPSPVTSPLAPSALASPSQPPRPNPIALLFTPPFIAFPILFFVSILVAAGMWARGPIAGLFYRPPVLPEATVTHRSLRLDERAPDGGVPGEAAQPTEAPPLEAAAPEPPPEAPPPAPPPADEPPDLPEPGE